MAEEHLKSTVEKLKQGIETSEKARQSLKETVGKMRTAQKGAFLVGIVVLCWLAYHFWPLAWLGKEFQHQPKTDAAIQTMTVQPQPISQELSLTGKLEPFRTVNIPAPFDGPVTEVLFTYGQEVKKGQKLATIDDSDLLIKLRNAETDYIKARQEFDDTKHWKQTTEMRDAERDLVRSKNDKVNKKRKLDEAQALYKDGIISRNDLEQAQEDYSNSLDTLASSRDKYDAELKKGDYDYLRMAQIKLENAEATYDNFKKKAAKAVVISPVQGVTMKPEASGSGKAVVLTEGTTVSQNQPMLAIASLESMEVQAKADEVDVVRLKVGQKVHVTGEAFPGTVLAGEIHNISSQSISSSDSQRPYYSVNVTVDKIPAALASTVRIGMTAELQVVVYENPKAILVPINAVNAGAKTVQILDPTTNKPKTVQVTTGITTLQDVEILKGLKVGDKVVTP